MMVTSYPTITVTFGGPRPPIVCLCGSTRHYDAFQEHNLRLTLAGQIVLSIGCETKSDGDLEAAKGFGLRNMAIVKADLDALHKRKIDLADYVLVLNVGGYIGESTRSEIDYAIAHGKPVEFLEPGGDDPAPAGAKPVRPAPVISLATALRDSLAIRRQDLTLVTPRAAA